MKKNIYIRWVIVLLVAALFFVNACDQGGGSTHSDNPASIGTVFGSVSGTTILALDDDGMIVSSDHTKGRSPDLDLDEDGVNESFSFMLDEVPVGMRLRIYLVTNEDVFPMSYEYNGDNANVFSLLTAASIDLGFVYLEEGGAIPEINPSEFPDINPEGADTERKSICGVTIDDFVGTWHGDVPYSMSDGEDGTAVVTVTLSVNGENQLEGTMAAAEGWSQQITGTESGGVFDFNLPNVHPELKDTDCANWNVSFTASLDCSLSKMDLTGGGTFCDISGGKPGTFSGFLNKAPTDE
jgi:hypothetical protein